LTLEPLEDRLSPATLTVNSTADTASDSDNYLSLREAIAVVNSPTLPGDLSSQIQGQISGTLHNGSADTIAFDPAQVTGPITLGGAQLELSLPAATAAVTIAGGTGVTVDGNDASRVLLVDTGAQVTLAHLTVAHGRIPGVAIGGGILNAGTLTLTSSTVSASSCEFGAGIYNEGGTLLVTNSTLSNNTAYFGGGIENDSGTLTVTDSTLTANAASSPAPNAGDGGGIYNYYGTLTVTSSTLSANSASRASGGIHNANGTVTVDSSTLSANSASYFPGGGGIGNAGSLTVTNSTLSSNSSTNGGGIDNQGTLTVISSTLAGNSCTSSGSGGGIYNSPDGTLTVTSSTLSSNSAFEGGGIHNEGGTVTVTSSTLSFNSAYAGAAIYDEGGPVMVTSSTLSANSTSGYGGGIFNQAGTVTVTSSTLAANSASISGGGIYNGAMLTVTSSTLTANSAGYGGGIYNYLGTATVTSSTLTANSARVSGGGIYNAVVSPVILQSTIVAANQGDDISGGYSQTHSLVGGDPRLSPLGYYGGPTQTFALLSGSPARDAGDPSLTGTDQRGQPRVIAGSSDIGAFQTQAAPFLVTTLTDPGQQFGQLSLREAVNLADALPGDNTVTFSDAFDFGTVTLTAGQLELSGAGGVRTIDGGNRITIDGNHASRLFQVDAGVQAVLTRLDLANGSSDSGGALFNSGTVTLAYCTLYGNAAIYGGAVCNLGILTAFGTTFGYNFAWYQGGGLLNAGTLTAFNDTFAYDTAFSDGGAIYSETGNATLTSLTISLNNSASGGGLAVASGNVLLRNCIIAGNLNDTSTAASDIAGRLDASSSYNLIGTGGSGGLSDGSNHNHVGVADPGLTPPDFSSTLSPVFGFTSSSPALGAGDPSLLSDPLLRLDQHGNARNSPPNIGAM
jgi:hypothetical protein